MALPRLMGANLIPRFEIPEGGVEPDLEQRTRLGLLVSVFVVFTLAFAAAGYGYYLQQSARLTGQLRGELETVSDVKAQQVADWVRDIESDANVNAKSPYLADGVRRFLSGPSTLESDLAIRRRLAAELERPDLRSVALIDSALRVRMEVGEWSIEVGSDMRAGVTDAIGRNQVVMRGLHETEDCSQLHLDLLVPIVTGPRGQVGAVVMERADPAVLLFPKLQSWPGRSRSAQVRLVQGIGESVVYLNEPGRDEETSRKAFPADSPSLPGAMAVRGESGIVSGVDENGAAVLASLRPVSGTPWFIVAQVAQEEVDEPVRRQAIGTASVGFGVLLLAGLSVALLWRAQTTQFYKRLYQAEVERHHLERHVEYLTKYANDIILVADPALSIVDVNDRAVDAYGYSREELLGMSVADLSPSSIRQGLSKALERLKTEDGIVYETMHQRKDGSKFPIESSVRVATSEEGTSYRFIIRDITRRKRAEREAREHRRKLAALAAELSLAEERERRRLAIGLHDQIGQALAMARIRLGSLSESADDADVKSGIREVYDALDQTIQETRSLAFELSPPVLYELGLLAAIEWLADDMVERHGLRCTVEGDAVLKELDKDLSVVLFGLVRELLLNVVKHARAHEVAISLSSDARSLHISVRDDGIGFDTERATGGTEGPHFGLFSVRERLEQFGGRFLIESDPGRGTTATLVAPLKATARRRRSG